MNTPMEFKLEIIVKTHKDSITEEQAVEDIKGVLRDMYDTYLSQSLLGINNNYEEYKANKKEIDYKRMIVYYIAHNHKITKADEFQRNIQTATED